MSTGTFAKGVQHNFCVIGAPSFSVPLSNLVKALSGASMTAKLLPKDDNKYL